MIELSSSKSERDLIVELCVSFNHFERELIGNGQPGRLREIEDKIENLETHRDKVLGIFAVFLPISGLVGAFVEYLVTRIWGKR